MTNDLTNDIVVEQNETTYDRGGNVVLLTRYERLHDATGTGPLHGPHGDLPRARRSFAALYVDAIGRSRFSADFGTNGGAELERPELPPAPSSVALVNEWNDRRGRSINGGVAEARRANPARLCLVSQTRYAADGQAGCEIGPDEAITQTTRNRLGEPIRTIEAFGTEAQRTVRFRRHATGQVSHLILENPDTGEQVTEWLFGTTLASSGIARNDLVSGKVYPTGESESSTFNRQSQRKTSTDPNGSVREFYYDKLGQLTDDAATTLAEGVDGTMRRVSITYNNQGRPEFYTTSDDPDPGSGTVINQVKRVYNAVGLLIADQQEHNGAVNGSTPTVSYEYTDGAGNVLRRTAVTAPSGAQVDSSYGSSGSITDVFNRVASLKVNGESSNLVDYSYAGIGRVVTLTYPAPDAQLSYLQVGGDPGQSDAGDSMSGYDRFGRTQRMPWKKTTGGDILADIAYGYDAASRRIWRQDLTPASEAAFDRFYGYDTLGQVKAADRGTLNENRTAIGGVPDEAEAWNYDEQGNWLTYRRDEDGTNEIDQTRRHNRSNQILTVDGSNEGVSFDKNGNMLRVPTGHALSGPPRYLRWNAWNQLVEVRDDEDELIQRNAYDGLFRRTTRELNDTSVIHSYYNDQWRPVEERIDSSTEPIAVYFWGDRYRDDLARRDRDTTGGGTLDESLWCLMDYFDPIVVIGDEGEVVERYAYSTFGVANILEPDYSVRSSSSVGWNFLFHGQFEDSETRWQNYGYRFYVPELGRWPSRDPIGEEGGWNLYGFVGNSPTNVSDFYGQYGILVAIGVAARAAGIYLLKKAAQSWKSGVAGAASGGLSGFMTSLADTRLGAATDTLKGAAAGLSGGLSAGMTENIIQDIPIVEKFDIITRRERMILGGAVGGGTSATVNAWMNGNLFPTQSQFNVGVGIGIAGGTIGSFLPEELGEFVIGLGSGLATMPLDVINKLFSEPEC